MTCQVLNNGYALFFVARRGEELEEKCAANADSIRETLRDAYMLSARNKEETHVYIRAVVERSFVEFSHQITVLPGDTANGLETMYSAYVYMRNENKASMESAVKVLQERLTANPANSLPSERWLVTITSLMEVFGKESTNTKIVLGSQMRINETAASIVYEIKGRTVWTENGFSFHNTEDMRLETVVEEIRANIALMEEKLRLGLDWQTEDPISSIRFWYHTHRAGWGVLVSFLCGGHTKISAQNDEIVVEAHRGNAIMTSRIPPVPELFVFTREGWERALCTAISVINADVTEIVELLGENRWGRGRSYLASRQIR